MRPMVSQCVRQCRVVGERMRSCGVQIDPSRGKELDALEEVAMVSVYRLG